MNRLLLIALTVCVASCATGQWTHPTKDETAFNADKYQCEKDAYEYADNVGATANPIVAAEQFKKCMAVKGYTLTS